MIKFLQSDSVCPYFNLALEQYVFDRLDRDFEYFLLWQNDRTVVVGRHQDTLSEINSTYVRANGVSVVRRLSGGGAVYHDLGNVNYSFIADAGTERYDFSLFAQPVISALAGLGVDAQYTGRNDLTVNGLKISGNAQYQKEGRVMHHGAILFDSDLTALEKALAAPLEKLRGKGVKSVRSRVTNIRPLLKHDMDVSAFMEALRRSVVDSLSLSEFALTKSDICEIEAIRDSRYITSEWNYGEIPGGAVRKKRRIEGVGTVEVCLVVCKEKIAAVRFFGDYFGEDAAPLESRLIGCAAEPGVLGDVLKGVDTGLYFNGMHKAELIALLTE